MSDEDRLFDVPTEGQAANLYDQTPTPEGIESVDDQDRGDTIPDAIKETFRKVQAEDADQGAGETVSSPDTSQGVTVPDDLASQARELGLPDSAIAAFDSVEALQAFVDRSATPSSLPDGEREATPAPNANETVESVLDQLEFNPDDLDEETLGVFNQLRDAMKQELGVLQKQVDEFLSKQVSQEYDQLFAGIDDAYAEVLAKGKSQSEIDASSAPYQKRADVIDLMNVLEQKGVARSEALNRACAAIFPEITQQKAQRELAGKLRGVRGNVLARGSSSASAPSPKDMSKSERIAVQLAQRFGPSPR